MKKLLLICLGLVLGACNVVDNQLIVSSDDLSVANPEPTKRDFVGNNSNHKVLLAVVDTGVDYNHPLLADNIHFALDAKGKPIGNGYDYTGLDTWSAPYVVRTSVYDPNLKEDDRGKALENRDALVKILSFNKHVLGSFLDIKRNVAQEFATGAYHGTHVSGLMVYDRPDFGLLAYRVIPMNNAYNDSHDYNQDFVDSLAKALDQAAGDGARVVNMSLGMKYDKAVEEDDGKTAVIEYEKVKAYAEKLRQVMTSHPDVLFIAAAGNDGAWIDGNNKNGLPCGVKTSNMLCVGALRDNGDPAPFTNLVISGVDVVFALGVNVISTLPTDMCTSSSMQQLYMAGNNTSDSEAEDLSNELKGECPQKSKMGPLSGTSMASPLVAHIAGEILAQNPNLSGAELVSEIKKQAQPDQIGIVPVYKLKVKKPSWYKKFEPKALFGKKEVSDEWVGYLPRKK